VEFLRQNWLRLSCEVGECEPLLCGRRPAAGDVGALAGYVEGSAVHDRSASRGIRRVCSERRYLRRPQRLARRQSGELSHIVTAISDIDTFMSPVDAVVSPIDPALLRSSSISSFLNTDTVISPIRCCHLPYRCCHIKIIFHIDTVIILPYRYCHLSCSMLSSPL
jgi:hypothetical protein